MTHVMKPWPGFTGKMLVSHILLIVLSGLPSMVGATGSASSSGAEWISAGAPAGDPGVQRLALPPTTTFQDLVDRGLVVPPVRHDADSRNSTGVGNLDPGVSPEGDYMGWPAFTPDGARVLVTNRVTNNVTVYDWATRQVITNIPLGTYPAGIAVTPQYAIVACAFSNDVYVINLSDYSIAAIIPTGEQPWVVRVNPAGTRAYVTCDIANTCEEIDLVTLQHGWTISDFPVGILQFSWFSENGRNSIVFTNFEVTMDGSAIVVGDWIDAVRFYDTATGTLAAQVNGIPSCVAVGLSGNGQKLVALCTTTPGSVYQVDLPTRTVTGSVSLTGYGISTFELAVNQDGSKSFLGIDNNSSAIARFATSDFHVFTSTYTPYWIGVSPDRALAIGGQYNFSIVDFATETLKGQYAGNTQYYGAVSPVGRRVASFDTMRREALLFYDYTTPTAPQYLGATPAGLDPEGDAPRRVRITPDGTRALVSNVLSGNLTIVNLNSFALEAVLPISDRVQDMAITPDSRWAVVCAMEAHAVRIVDLSTNTIAATVSTNLRPTEVSISPDGQRAYVANIQGNTVSVVVLSGATSYRAADIPVGEIGGYYVGYGVNDEVKVSPDGHYAVMAVALDDNVKVIDATTNAIVSTLTVGDAPMGLAFNGNGQYAIVTNYLGNSYSVLRINGAGSSVVGTFARGQYPLRLAYDPIHSRTGIGNYGSKTVSLVNPETGALLGTSSYAAYGNVLGVLFDALGDPLVLTVTGSSPPGYVVSATESFALPATPTHFDYSPTSRKAAVVMPGPDYLTVISWDTTDLPQTVTIPLTRPGTILPTQPNPASDFGQLEFALARASQVDLFLCDSSGRRVLDLAGGHYSSGQHGVHWAAGGIPSGVYFAVLSVDGIRVDSKKVTLTATR